MSDDHVGFAYVALHPLLDWSNDLTKSLGSAGGIAPTARRRRPATSALPDWGAYSLRFQSDAIVMEATSPVPETRLGPTENRRSTIAEHVPATALVAAMSNDLGTTLKQTLALYRGDPTFKPVIDQVDQALGLIGGADAAFGWVGDSAVVVSAPNGTPEGGAIIVPNDKAAADAPVHRLALVHRHRWRPAGDHRPRRGLQRDDDHGHRPRRPVQARGDGRRDRRDRRACPADRPRPDRLRGDRPASSSSAPGRTSSRASSTRPRTRRSPSNDRYSSLADRAGAGTGSTWVDITAIRGLIEKAAAGSAADTAAIAKYQTDIKPFLAPFDAIYASSSTGNDLNRSVIYVTVK